MAKKQGGNSRSTNKQQDKQTPETNEEVKATPDAGSENTAETPVAEQSTPTAGTESKTPADEVTGPEGETAATPAPEGDTGAPTPDAAGGEETPTEIQPGPDTSSEENKDKEEAPAETSAPADTQTPQDDAAPSADEAGAEDLKEETEVEDEEIVEDKTNGGRYDLIDTTDMSPALATMANVINNYLKAMAPNQITEMSTIINQQKLLIGVINNILAIEDGPQFKAAMDMFRDAVKSHRDRQFHEARIFRGYNELGIAAKTNRRATYFLTIMMAHVDTGDQNTTSRVDVTHLTDMINNGQAKQLVSSYFGAQ